MSILKPCTCRKNAIDVTSHKHYIFMLRYANPNWGDPYAQVSGFKFY